MDVKAIQIYKDVSNNIKQKMEEARACHDLDLAVDLGCLQLECKIYLQKRMIKVMREAGENMAADPDKIKNVQTRIDDTSESIWRMRVDPMWDYEKRECFEIFHQRIGELNYRYDEEVIGRILAIGENWIEYDKEVVEVVKILDTISEVEEELKDIWNEAAFLMK
jgi:hypothetical protein